MCVGLGSTDGLFEIADKARYLLTLFGGTPRRIQGDKS
jgi:hypothetical protein